MFYNLICYRLKPHVFTLLGAFKVNNFSVVLYFHKSPKNSITGKPYSLTEAIMFLQKAHIKEMFTYFQRMHFIEIPHLIINS